MNRKNLARMLTVVCAVSLLLTACDTGGSTPPEGGSGTNPGNLEDYTPTGTETYSIYLGRDRILVDRDGNEIPDDRQFDTLWDVGTDEAQVQVLRRQEAGESRNQYGEPDVTYSQSLYDMEGNLLIDWGEYIYAAGFGDFVVQREYQSYMGDLYQSDNAPACALIHYKTGEVVFEDAYSVSKMGGDRYLLLDYWGSPLGTVNRAGEVRSGFPVPDTYYQATPFGDFIVAHNQNPYFVWEGTTQTLLTADFEPVLTMDSLDFSRYMLRGDYIQFRNGSKIGVMDIYTNILFETEAVDTYVHYFDSELVVLQSVADYESYTRNYTLMTHDGTVLADGYTYMDYYASYYDAVEAKQFLCVKEVGKLEILDRAGSVTNTVELPGLESASQDRDGYLVATCYDGDYNYTCAFLAPDGKVLIPQGQYDYFNRLANWSGNRSEEYYDLVAAQVYDDVTGRHVDIYDLSGNVVIKDLRAYNSVGYDRISVEQGFSTGLMDFKGNWIVKYSIFSRLEDE